MAKPPTTADLKWIGDLQFVASFGKSTMTIDGSGTAGPSPLDALAGALAGCMSTDVVDILVKGRQPLRQLTSRLVAHRAPDPPHRFIRAELTFVIAGDVMSSVVERAIRLSRDKYCSVWHSMRQDIDFQVTFELQQ